MEEINSKPSTGGRPNMNGASLDIQQYIQQLESEMDDMKTKNELFQITIQNQANTLKEQSNALKEQAKEHVKQFEIQAKKYESALEKLKTMIIEKESVINSDSIVDPPNTATSTILNNSNVTFKTVLMSTVTKFEEIQK